MAGLSLEPPEQLNISVESISAHRHGLDEDALPKSYSLFDEQDRGKPH